MKKNFYSPTKPEVAEEAFRLFERGHKEDVQAALSLSVADQSRKRDLVGGAMLAQALTAFVRNPVHVNDRQEEQFDAMAQAGEMLHRRLLRGWNEGESEVDFLARATSLDRRSIPNNEAGRTRLISQIVADRWAWTVLRTPASRPLMMSDTPVRLFQMPWGGVVWLWPLTSNALFVAATRGDSEIRQRRLAPAEVSAVNEIIVARAFNWAISATEIPNDQLQIIATLWAKHGPLTSRFGADGWYGAIPRLSKSPLAFLQPKLGSTPVWENPAS